MAGEKNFNIKNGLSIGGVEVINSSGNITAGGIGTAVQEAIADKIGSIIQGSGSTTVTYDDDADTITISSTGKTEEEIQDIIGAAIVTNGSHTGLSVAYDDAGDGAIDITVDYSAIASNLIPDGNETRDLGSSTNRWRDLYLSGNTINLGGTEFSKDSDGNVEVSASGTLKSLKVAEIEIGTGSDVLVLKRDSNGKLQSRSKNTSTKTETAQDIDLTNNDSDDLSEGSSNLYFTDARVMTSLATVDTHIVPTTDVTYDFGSPTKQWRDVYVGPGSLYVNGQQVVSDNSGTITISADSDQNVSVQTGGSGDIELDATGTGTIQIKAPMQIQASNAISSSDGNAIQFSNSIDVDAIESRSADTNLVLTGNGTGNVTVNDALVVTGNLTVQGTTTTVNSETISLADNIIALNSNFTSGSPTEDTGISVTSGGSAAKTLLWDETNDKWTVGSETFVAATFEGALTGNAATATALATSRTIGLSGDVTGSGSFDGTGNLTITATIADDSHNHIISNVDWLQTALDTKYQSGSNATLGTITTTNASNAGGYVRNIYQSTSSPAAGDGAVGDLWVLYS